MHQDDARGAEQPGYPVEERHRLTWSGGDEDVAVYRTTADRIVYGPDEDAGV